MVVRFKALAIADEGDGRMSTAPPSKMFRDVFSLRVFSGTKGVSTADTVTSLGRPMPTTHSANLLWRVFMGAG